MVDWLRRLIHGPTIDLYEDGEDLHVAFVAKMRASGYHRWVEKWPPLDAFVQIARFGGTTRHIVRPRDLPWNFNIQDTWWRHADRGMTIDAVVEGGDG